METKKRYIVAQGASFVGEKKTYKEGDEIDESAFKTPERFKQFLNSKPPKIIEAPAGEKAEEKPAGSGGGGNKLDRKALEELALKDNFMKPDQIKALKDDELEKALRDAGKIK